MARNRDMEKAFEQDVERLLRGEEPSGAYPDEAYEDTLQFARRLVSLREEPDSEFTSRLRARLLVEMAEQDRDTSQCEGNWSVRMCS